jgi:GH24 family phage-related lysozyme (muramidase)
LNLVLCTLARCAGLIAGHEGKRLCVYKDTRGIPTIGIGYNLDNGGARQAIAKVGANYDKVLSGAQCLTDAQVMELFEPSYEQAVFGAKGDVSSFNSLCCGVQEVMTDMAYNLGAHGELPLPALSFSPFAVPALRYPVLPVSLH